MSSRADVSGWASRLLARLGLCACASISATAQGFPTSRPAAPVAQPAPSAAAASAATGPATTAAQRLVNINTASKAELKTLPGIGDAEAERIVTHRPYATKTHLVEKKVLGLASYSELRGLIVVDHRRAGVRPRASTP